MHEEEKMLLLTADPIIYYDTVNNIYGFYLSDKLYNEIVDCGQINSQSEIVKYIENTYELKMLSLGIVENELFKTISTVGQPKMLAIQFYLKDSESELLNLAQYLRKEWL